MPCGIYHFYALKEVRFMANCLMCGKRVGPFAGKYYFLLDSKGNQTKQNICQECNQKLVLNHQGVMYDETAGKIVTFDASDTVKKEEIKLEKSYDSFCRVFGGYGPKHQAAWKEAVESILGSMREDEEILHGFLGTILNINHGQESITSYVGVITNRRFYYIGKNGKELAFITSLRSGSVGLKDAHAIMTAKDVLGNSVKFEVKNEDYWLATNEDTQLIKNKLEEAVSMCESADTAPVVVQNAVSAMDELKKLKELLDMGIVTQEEFDAKKKQLLGL